MKVGHVRVCGSVLPIYRVWVAWSRYSFYKVPAGPASTVRYGPVRCGTVHHGPPRCDTVRPGASRCGLARHGVAQ